MEGMKVAVTKIKTKRVQRRKIRIIERRITLTGIEKDYIYEDASRFIKSHETTIISKDT